jgi:hypothetical protein
LRKDASEKRFGGWLVKFKGMEVTFNAFGEPRQRVKSVKIGGTPLDPARVYSGCRLPARWSIRPTMLCRIPKVTDGVTQHYTLHQMMKEYLAVHYPGESCT